MKIEIFSTAAARITNNNNNQKKNGYMNLFSIQAVKGIFVYKVIKRNGISPYIPPKFQVLLLCANKSG